MIEGYSSIHWAVVAALRPPQNIHAGNWIRSDFLAVRHMWSGNNVESADVQGGSFVFNADGVEGGLNSPSEEACQKFNEF